MTAHFIEKQTFVLSNQKVKHGVTVEHKRHVSDYYYAIFTIKVIKKIFQPSCTISVPSVNKLIFQKLNEKPDLIGYEGSGASCSKHC